MSTDPSQKKIKRFLPSDDEIEKALMASLQAEGPASPGDASGVLSDIRPGQAARGRVLAVSGDQVIVDLGYKAEGLIPLDEFPAPGPEPGSTVEAVVVRMENADGQVELSLKEANRRRIWEDVRDGAENAETVFSGKILEAVKGGLIVDIGMRAFLPAREVDLRYVEDLEAFVGRHVDVRVIETDQERNRVIVSRRAILERDQEARARRLWESLAEGQTLSGTVTNVVDFGAFVDLGGVEGLVHRADMAWGHVEHPSEILSPGQEVEVTVQRIERDRKRISLTMKSESANPWSGLAQRYPFASVVRGRVTRLAAFGAFVTLEDGVEGLVHVSELSWTRRCSHPSEMLKEGQEVTAIVLSADEERQRLSLSIKQTEPDPWWDVEMDHPVGSRIAGTVRDFKPFGAMVEVKPGLVGMIHISQMGRGHVNRPEEVLRTGDRVTCEVLEVDEESRRMGLRLVERESPDS